MKTTKENFSYYFNFLATPSYMMRHALEEDYSIIALGHGCLPAKIRHCNDNIQTLKCEL